MLVNISLVVSEKCWEMLVKICHWWSVECIGEGFFGSLRRMLVKVSFLLVVRKECWWTVELVGED